jgi:hypothetical protein
VRCGEYCDRQPNHHLLPLRLSVHCADEADLPLSHARFFSFAEPTTLTLRFLSLVRRARARSIDVRSLLDALRAAATVFRSHRAHDARALLLLRAKSLDTVFFSRWAASLCCVLRDCLPDTRRQFDTNGDGELDFKEFSVVRTGTAAQQVSSLAFSAPAVLHSQST